MIRAHLQVYINIDLIASTAADLFPSPNARSVMRKVGRCRRVHNLINAGSVQSYLLVVCVAKLSEAEDVVATSFWLNCEFSARAWEHFDILSSGFLVFLRRIVYMERRCAVQYE